MKRKVNRGMVSLILAIVMTIGVSLSVCAETNTTVHQYVAVNGTVYNYYLDETGNPYTVINAEKVYLALPLEHLRVTDFQKIDELNAAISNTSIGRSTPTTYYDISDNNDTEKLNSSVYSADVNFDDTPTFTTEVLKVNRQHATVRFKTSDIKKENIFAGKKVNFTFYYFDPIDEEWYSQAYSDKDCTGATGFGILFSPSVNQYLQFDISKSSKIKSLTLEIWTTGLW